MSVCQHSNVVMIFTAAKVTEVFQIRTGLIFQSMKVIRKVVFRNRVRFENNCDNMS